MDNDHSDQFLTVTGWALKDRHLVLKLQKLIWRWAPAKTLGKMSSKLISSWKGSKRRSLSLFACDPPLHIGINKMPSNQFGKYRILPPVQICCQRVCYPMIFQARKFVRNWFPKTVLPANLYSCNFFYSQMKIDATLLSICSFCNIWYRSLSNFYSATAKHTMYDGVLWWSIHGEVLLQIFTFWFKVFSSDIFVDPTHNDARHSAQAHKGRFLFHQIKWFLRNFLNGPLPRVGKI